MDSRGVAEGVLRRLKKAGASESEVFLQTGSHLTIEVRNQKLERLTQAETRGLGVRVIVNRRLAFVHSSDFQDRALDDLAKRAVALAREAEPDEFNQLPVKGGTPTRPAIYDPSMKRVPLEKKVPFALEAEKAAFAYDPLIKRSDGCSYAEYEGETWIMNSHGLERSYRSTFFSLGISIVAEKEGEMQVGENSSEARYFESLDSPGEVGREGARRAALLIGGRPVKTQEVPVIFEPRAGGSLFWGLSGALNGGNVLLGSSFLAGKEGEAVASKVVTLIADGTLPRGVASSPVDGEGVPTARNVLIDRGVLKGYLYNTYAAAKAKKKSTGSAWRESYSELPDIGTGNFFFQRGDRTPENIIEATTEGFYVFEASGFGVNPVTGGYSLGATGVWVKDGRLSQPVARVTIASNISQMLLNLDLMGSDLSFDHGWTCPHFRVQHMMVSGVE